MLDLILKYGTLISAFIGVFSVIAAMTPNKSDDKVIDFIIKVVNVLGLNFKRPS